MHGVRQPLRLYGRASDLPPVPWSWVEEQLTAAGTYWVVPRADGHPHPRPVWGIWSPPNHVVLSIGSPVIVRALGADPAVTVHLESGTDVVVVEGRVDTRTRSTPELLAAYNAKYDWDYCVEEYGDLTVVAVERVLAWRSAGWAGRESFQATGSWVFDEAVEADESGS